ncbi:MAG: PH domain-containing protein [bacterium]|nr:PH domain-containing protein [bacterium]MDA1024715.1 PH domain-containing protein [bacterium]
MIHLNKLPNHQRGETAEVFLRRHWIAIVMIGLYFAALMLIPVIILVFLSVADLSIFNTVLIGPLVSVLMACYVMMIMIVTMTQFTDYYLDTWIVTTERIINIEQIGLFTRVVSELNLPEIQDITAETTGVLATLLSYGNVYIQTAATRERFNFKQIDNPEHVKEDILRLTHAAKVRHGELEPFKGGWEGA